MDTLKRSNFSVNFLALLIFSCVISPAAQEGSGYEGSGTITELNEEIAIKNTELQYMQLHFHKWIENKAPNPANIHGNSTEKLTQDLSVARYKKLYNNFTSEVRMCYNCVGMILNSGHVYGCTENIDGYDLDEATEDFMVPCYGDCMISRRITDGSVTIVRSCHSKDCPGSKRCVQQNGACIKCCQKNFCNRNLPTSFLVQRPGNMGNKAQTLSFKRWLSILIGSLLTMLNGVMN